VILFSFKKVLINFFFFLRFNASLDAIFNRWRFTPNLFKKTGWREAGDRELREWYFKHFQKEVKKYEWNSDTKVSDFSAFSLIMEFRTNLRCYGWLMVQMKMQFGT